MTDIARLPAGLAVQLLGNMGSWAYVEALDKGQLLRGFVQDGLLSAALGNAPSEPLASIAYSWAFQGDVAFILDNRGKIGLIGRDGSMLVPPQFDDAEPFVKGLALVRQGDKFRFINAKGEIASKPVWDSAGSFSNGLAPVQQNDQWGLINTEGEVIAAPAWDSEPWFYEGMAVVQKDEKYGLTNSNGSFP